MRIIPRFIQDRRGSSFESIALSASVIAITFVAGADFLSYVGRSGELSKTALVRESRDIVTVARSLPRSNDPNIDYTPTGAIPALKQRSILDPCTGQTR
jgi:hypothetical protein